MTSNIGAKKVSDFGGGVGFTTSSSETQKYEVRKSIIQKSLKQQFNPEFLNRIDDVILFNKLDKDVMNKIIQIELNKLVNRLKEKNYNITFDKTIISRISELNTQEDYGARPIKRIIQNLCEDFLSDEILKGTIKEKTNVTLRIKDGEIKIFKK
jgi:ATP-dependent Clp protease ATP-binding subunit ClpC